MGVSERTEPVLNRSVLYISNNNYVYVYFLFICHTIFHYMDQRLRYKKTTIRVFCGIKNVKLILMLKELKSINFTRA